MSGYETTRDGFLDGKLQINQLKQGYRAATDPVFLAAFTPAKQGESVLELGCGVGTASFCLGWRVADLALSGVEIQVANAELARANAALNKIPFEVTVADVKALPAEIRSRSFDHVIANPPFFARAGHTGSPVLAKDLAHRADDPVEWIALGLKRLKPKGRITLIQRCEHLASLLAALTPQAGDIQIKPISAREGSPADRVLISARKGSKAKLTLLPSLIVHEGATHQDGPKGYSSAAQAILRDGKGLIFR